MAKRAREEGEGEGEGGGGGGGGISLFSAPSRKKRRADAQALAVAEEESGKRSGGGKSSSSKMGESESGRKKGKEKKSKKEKKKKSKKKGKRKEAGAVARVIPFDPSQAAAVFTGAGADTEQKGEKKQQQKKKKFGGYEDPRVLPSGAEQTAWLWKWFLDSAAAAEVKLDDKDVATGFPDVLVVRPPALQVPGKDGDKVSLAVDDRSHHHLARVVKSVCAHVAGGGEGTGGAWKQHMRKDKPRAGSPRLLMLTNSALRAVDYLRALRPLNSQNMLKLFARHIKPDEQMRALCQPAFVGVGTPNRVLKLARMKGLDLGETRFLVLDCGLDSKQLSLFQYKDAARDVFHLLREFGLERLRSGELRVLFF